MVVGDNVGGCVVVVASLSVLSVLLLIILIVAGIIIVVVVVFVVVSSDLKSHLPSFRPLCIRTSRLARRYGELLLLLLPSKKIE
jgi:hypothetical protein